MITVSDLGLAYSGQPLFAHVDFPVHQGQLLRHHRRQRRG